MAPAPRARGWLADRRSEVAAERILDAAATLFTGHDPETVGMNEIARAAGCSRATVYRYFENREALHRAYVHREARALNRLLTERLAEITDPRTRLVSGMTEAIALVRRDPALSSWFARTGPLGGEMADRSEVIIAMVAAFLEQLQPDAAPMGPDAQRRARWVVRVMTSLLVFPGRDEAEEAAMLTEFVAPLVVPSVRRG
ncbi:TetR/AcrR family transcriptional regulator [Mycolicibacillus parakoreensis]|uniref:TetR/AcrR family transcriptional regulator n=1 Tax=Mycolicibacillus parakoreensis TaxID=1069221 RepID=A0ABY3U947_9MYCO|nr:TetR/AcrR family transcriptional regulator [Mycolicibacillus parakoreensis]MCV7314980.1 TetR/AcrR family transcriptional regulator [Mycolicibacillus parakoreensis]ULN54476.1 TetR/AcrR family transcriptional regulator [Mycolicibacillus parakoreensis]